MEKIYKDEIVGDVLLRKSPRSSRISIRVHPVKGIIVSIPYFLSYEQGLSFLDSKRDWIVDVLAKQEKKRKAAEVSLKAVPAIVDETVVKTLLSEIIFYHDDILFRKESFLKVQPVIVEDLSVSKRLYLSLDKPVVRKNVHFQNVGGEALTAELIKILRAEAKNLLPRKLQFFAEKYGFTYHRLAIKHNSTNWGSCSSKGNINLNLNLVRLPEPLCDYVILHELAHLRYPNHGPAFHELLCRLCSDNIARLSILGDPYVTELSAKIASRKSPIDSILKREVSKYSLV
jgi:predicted metal-dependent hydrolase